MAKCKKCNVTVDTRGKCCPLCNSKIDFCENPTYPLVITSSTWNFIKRLLLTIVIFGSAIVIFINKTWTPNTKWSAFVVMGLVTMYVIFLGIIKGHKRVISMMFYMCFLLIIVTILWDKMLGFKGWSINYVLPSLAISYGIFLLVMRFVSHLTILDNCLYIYLHVLLEFVPIILYYKDLLTFKPLAVISAIFGMVNLAVLLIFDFTHLKKDIAMRLHI